MSFKENLLCTVVATVAITTVTASQADDYLPDGWLPTGNYLLLEASASYADKNDTELRNTSGVGVRYGMQWNEEIDFQFGINHTGVSKNSNKLQQSLLSAEAMYMFSRGVFRPFVSTGLGIKQDATQLDSAEKTSGASPYVSVGAGFQWMITNQLGLQTNLRRIAGNNKAVSNAHGASIFNLGLMLTIEKAPAEAATPSVASVSTTAHDTLPPVSTVEPMAAAPDTLPSTPLNPAPQHITLAAASLFNLNSARITSSVAELDELAKALQSNPQIASVVITGHTDQLGNEAVNRRLSQARAQAVKNYLVGKGVEATRLIAKGAASSQLLTHCKLPSRAEMIICGAQNRRVEIEPITVTKL